MRLVLDPSQEARHEEWLRRTPGAYEWWYFDALSDCGEYALTCIWFLGNPFSSYYRASFQQTRADPYDHNALFFALYHRGRLCAYHFTRFSPDEITTDNSLAFGANRLTIGQNKHWNLSLHDVNGNGRTLAADLTFTAPLLVGTPTLHSPNESHSWLPIAPFCRVTGKLTLAEAHNSGSEEILFSGTGYHDHNWGRLPFDAEIRDWYWARAALSDERAVILYYVRRRHGKESLSHFLLFDQGRLIHYDSAPKVKLSRIKVNSFGVIYAAWLSCISGPVTAQFNLGVRLDSAPFYIRALCAAEVAEGGKTEYGQGMGRIFAPCHDVLVADFVGDESASRRTMNMAKPFAANPVYWIIAVRTAQVSLLAFAVHRALGWPFSGPYALGLFLTPALCLYFAFVFVAPWSWGLPILTRLPTKERVIALTFDDGPSLETTPQVLDILHEANVRATFFVLGEAVERFPDILSRIVAEGHTVGIHGYRHRPFVLLSPCKIQNEISQTRKAIRHVCTETALISWVRPPYGFKSETLLWAARRNDCDLAAWSLDSRDYRTDSPMEITRTVLSRLHPGAIILLHDGPANAATAAALPIILSRLAADCWLPVTLPPSRKSLR